MKTITLPNGYDRKRTPTAFRVISLSDVIAWSKPVSKPCTFQFCDATGHLTHTPALEDSEDE